MTVASRWGGLAVTAVLVVAVQVFAYSHKISRVDAETYAAATELEANDQWRYGYVRSHHGARLVKYPADGVVPKPDYRPDKSPELTEFMAAQLQAAPRKAVLEGALYCGAIALLLFLPLGLGRWARRPWTNTSVTVMVATTMLLLPLIILGYGASFGTTWVGPAPYSFSGRYLSLSWIQGLTVSYRPFLEIFMYVPRGVGQLLGFGRVLSEIHWRVGFLLPPLLIYGGTAALGSVVWVKSRTGAGTV